jgi:hypothetical protein
MTPEDRVARIDYNLRVIFRHREAAINGRGLLRSRIPASEWRFIFGFCYSMVKVKRGGPAIAYIKFHRRVKDV